jgi:hypothetical protein
MLNSTTGCDGDVLRKSGCSRRQILREALMLSAVATVTLGTTDVRVVPQGESDVVRSSIIDMIEADVFLSKSG